MNKSKKIVYVVLSLCVTVFVTLVVWNMTDNLLGGEINNLEPIKREFRYYDTYDTFAIEDGIEMVLQPSSNYIHAIETIFVGIVDDKKGSLEITLFAEETFNGEALFQTEIPIEAVPVGEWFEILIKKKVNPQKNYILRINAIDCEQAPSLLVVGEDFQKANTEMVYVNDEKQEKFLVAVAYRKEIKKIYKILLVFLIILIEFYFLYRILPAWPLRERILEIFFIATLAILFIILHFYKLDEYPRGVNVDEMGMLYDAWSLSKYGVDRTLTSFPIYFNNFGNGQSILYGYFCAVLIKLFGNSIFVMRFPAAIASIFTFIYGVKLVRLKWGGDKKAIYLFAILYTISPYFIMSSRVALDCNLSLTVSTVFLYYFIKAVQSKNKGYFVAAGIIGGVLLYSYALTWIALPLFLGIAIFYLFWIKNLSLRNAIVLMIPLCALAIPLLLFQWINITHRAPLHMGPITIRAIDFYRAELFSWKDFLGNCVKIIQGILFKNGPIYSSYQSFMPMLWISVPFAVVGAWHIYTIVCSDITKRQYCIEGIVGLWFAVQFCVGCLLSGQGPTTYRMNGIFFVLLWMILDGILFVFRKEWAGKQGLLILVALSYIIGTVQFSADYFEPSRLASREDCFFEPLDETIEYINTLSIEKASKDTYIYSGDDWWIYVYMLMVNKTSPYDFVLENGNRQHYQNYIFDYPRLELDRNANYIIEERYTDELDQLKQEGFSLKKVGRYYFGSMQ